MEPRIQYTTTSDGVSIAYAVFGDGPPMVWAPMVWGDIHLYAVAMECVGNTGWLVSHLDAAVERGWRVVLYDGRGSGSSQREVTDFSLQARIWDLEAVTEAVGVDRFVLWGAGAGGPAAIGYSVKHPERVSRLILVNTFAHGAEFFESVPGVRVARDLSHIAEGQWEFYNLAVANALLSFSDSDVARGLAQAFGSAMTPKAFLAYRSATEQIDVTDELAEVSFPTLVVYDKSSPTGGYSTLEARLASRIPNARFVVTEDLLRAVDGFLRESEQSTESAPALPHGTATILFADIADSTALTEQMGDAVFRAKAGELDAALRSIVRDSAGTPVDGRLVGDGLMAVFTSSHQAIACAQRGVEEGSRIGLPLHLGIHAGDVSREGNNVYGGAVNIAARVAAASAASEILVSDVVRTLARTSAAVTFEDRGEHSLKGVAEPQRLWAVRAGK